MSLPSVGESWSIGNYRDLMETKMMKPELYKGETATRSTNKKVSTTTNEISF